MEKLIQKVHYCKCDCQNCIDNDGQNGYRYQNEYIPCGDVDCKDCEYGGCPYELNNYYSNYEGFNRYNEYMQIVYPGSAPFIDEGCPISAPSDCRYRHPINAPCEDSLYEGYDCPICAPEAIFHDGCCIPGY